MRAVMLEVPEELLAERHRKGLDYRDEMWEGELHMVPSPTAWHQRFGAELLAPLLPVAKAKGLILLYETDLYRPGSGDKSYRCPDLMVLTPAQYTKTRCEGAELVIEILSPDDESREKLTFYAELGVKEVFFFDPDTRAVERYSLKSGRLVRARAGAGGVFRSEVLGVTFARRESSKGPLLDVKLPDGSIVSI